MSKGLEALENICNQCEHYQFEKGLRPKKCPFNKSCVFKQRIEKELKALDVLTDVARLKVYKNKLGQFFLLGVNILIPIDHETYDSLKEVLLCVIYMTDFMK